TVSQKTIYDNPWIVLSHREVITPGGSDGIYGVVHFKNVAIGIVVLDKEQNTWLVGQYRYTLERYSWEIPEGGCPLGTDPLDSAKRELLEETGITAGQWTHLMDFHLSNSVTDEAGVLYMAEDLSFGEAEPEDTEDLQVKKLPFTEAIELIQTGQITDSVSIMGLLQAERILRQRNA
ncbi:MAG: NUDIX hydrolase, partial [Bacteroidota bacterium]